MLLFAPPPQLFFSKTRLNSSFDFLNYAQQLPTATVTAIYNMNKTCFPITQCYVNARGLPKNTQTGAGLSTPALGYLR